MLGAPKLLHAARIVAPLAAVAALAACFRTEVLVQKFNEGVIETGTGDPKHSYESLRKETAYRRIYPELIDGYFGDGGTDAWIVKALVKQANDPCWFACQVGNWLCHEGRQGRVPCYRGELHPKGVAGCSCNGREPGKDKQLLDRVAAYVPSPDSETPLCSEGALDRAEAAPFVDTVRWRSALQRSIEGAAALIDEGQLPLRELPDAAATVFRAAAVYHANRKWSRNFDQPTLGLVVKGGASTGIFSAGAVWAVLSIINGCKADLECSERVDPRFTILSGTSTGSMIASAVDIYNAAACETQRNARLKMFAKWFVCTSSQELYCTEDGDLVDLIDGKQMSLLRLDGLQQLLDANLSQATLDNRSELVSSAVDFRTGRLDAISDQDPSQVKRPTDAAAAAIASAAFPVVVRPEPNLPIDHNGGGTFAYLDGGARSELPIGAAVRRGAERVLIVSSASSVIAETPELENGFEVLVRVIDVTVGGAHESEIEWAPKLAQSRRLAEFEECKYELELPRDKDPDDAKHPLPQRARGSASSARDKKPGDPKFPLCPPDSCDAKAICRGDWSNACKAAANGSRPRTASDLIRPLWQATSIYRDERLVPGLPGYVFRNTDQRKLFLAGAEEVRQRCLEIGALLGVLPVDANDDIRAKVLAWCAPSFTLKCGAQDESERLRRCADRLPEPERENTPCP